MKKYLLLTALLLPLIVSAQSKWKQRREEMKREYKEAQAKRKLDKTFSAGIDEAGYHLQKASIDYNTSILFTAIGAGVGAALMTPGGNSNIGVAIIAIGGVMGVVFHVAGNNEIRKAGDAMRQQAKLSFSGNKLTLNF